MVKYNMVLFILAQIFGFINFVLYTRSLWKKKKSSMLQEQVLCNAADILQYVCLFKWTACGINCVSLARNYIFSKRSDKRVLVVLLSVYFLLGILTYDGFISVCAITVAIIQTLLAYQDNPQNIRIGAVFIICFWIVYDYLAGAYITVLCDFVVFINGMLAINKYKSVREVGEVS